MSQPALVCNVCEKLFILLLLYRPQFLFCFSVIHDLPFAFVSNLGMLSASLPATHGDCFENFFFFARRQPVGDFCAFVGKILIRFTFWWWQWHIHRRKRKKKDDDFVWKERKGKEDNRLSFKILIRDQQTKHQVSEAGDGWGQRRKKRNEKCSVW